MADGAPNRHATVAQLREVLATLRDDDCVHTNFLGNLTVLRELASGDLNAPPHAIWCDFGGEDLR